MPAIELRQDEIGQYDPAAAKARRERLWGKPKVNFAIVRPAPELEEPEPAHEEPAPSRPKVVRLRPAPEPEDEVDELPIISDGRTIYPLPIGPCRPGAGTAPVRVRDLVKIVAFVYRVPLNCLMSNRRSVDVVRPRQELMWLAKKHTTLSLPHIGRALGRDHTTVLHAIRKIDRLIAENGYTPRADAYVADWVAMLNERARSKQEIIPVLLDAPVIAPPPPEPLSIPSIPPTAEPPEISTGRIWRQRELDTVRAMIAEGWTTAAIASHLGRSRSAVTNALKRHRDEVTPSYSVEG